jgi:hypothetical protein
MRGYRATAMTPYYPARDGHPSIFALEENAGAVKKLQVHPGQNSTSLAANHERFATAYRATEQDLYDLLLKTRAEGRLLFVSSD